MLFFKTCSVKGSLWSQKWFLNCITAKKNKTFRNLYFNIQTMRVTTNCRWAAKFRFLLENSISCFHSGPQSTEVHRRVRQMKVPDSQCNSSCCRIQQGLKSLVGEVFEITSISKIVSY